MHIKERVILLQRVLKRKKNFKVLELGVDYLQGYYLSYPQLNAQEVSNESIKTIEIIEEKMMKIIFSC